MVWNLLKSYADLLHAPETARWRFFGNATYVARAGSDRARHRLSRARAAHQALPRGLATFLVDGFVAGSWTIEAKRKAVLVLTPFGRLEKRDEAALRKEGERLLHFAEPQARGTASASSAPDASPPGSGPV